ncbi:hypothetical protein ACXIZN_41200 [Amycolatopsis sp. TRM77291]
MRTTILATAQDLLTQHLDDRDGSPLSLDEVAACSGLSRHHLRAYYTSPDAIVRDLHYHSTGTRSTHALD